MRTIVWVYFVFWFKFFTQKMTVSLNNFISALLSLPQLIYTSYLLYLIRNQLQRVWFTNPKELFCNTFDEGQTKNI